MSNSSSRVPARPPNLSSLANVLWLAEFLQHHGLHGDALQGPGSGIGDLAPDSLNITGLPHAPVPDWMRLSDEAAR